MTASQAMTLKPGDKFVLLPPLPGNAIAIGAKGKVYTVMTVWRDFAFRNNVYIRDTDGDIWDPSEIELFERR